MKQLVVLAGCAVLLSGLAGCRQPAQTIPPVSGVDPAHPRPALPKGWPRGGVEVIIEGGGEFPQFLVGRWKDEEYGWEFVFEPDGTISSAVIDSGFIKVIPSEGIASKPMRIGKAVYKLGQWTVQYSPGSHELAVEVVVDDFHIDMGPNALEGHSTDWFVGPVSEDHQTWQAEWISFPKYIALTPEPTELPVNPNETITTLVFKKVAD